MAKSLAALCRGAASRLFNRQGAAQKRNYLRLRERLDPLRDPSVDYGKPVLVISGITMRETGIFCDLLAFLRWVQFAERMGYIPVIDMQNVENLYLEDGEVGKVNSYEYFYRQPAGMSVEEAYRAKELYIVNRLDCPYDFTRAQKRCYEAVTSVKGWVYDEKRALHFDEYKRLYDTYFRVSDEAAAFTDACWQRLIPPSARVLGVLCRGSDYFTRHPYRHQIQPTLEQLVAKIEEFLAAHSVDKIFVATEDADLLAGLVSRFGEKIVFIDCPRVTAEPGVSVAAAFGKQRVNRKMNGLYYFASIACLSRCDSLIAGKTMATQFIRTMRDRDFDYEFYWNLGLYGVDDSK